MNKIKNSLILALLALSFSSVAKAQDTWNATTLSAAVTAGQNEITVASASGISAGYVAYVDREAMRVNSISGTTLRVTRGAEGTRAMPHLSGAAILVDDPAYFGEFDVAGACTAAGEKVLPRININNGKLFDCTGPSATTAVWTELGGSDGAYVEAIFCGQQANNGTIYMSPISGFHAGNLLTDGLTANDLSYIEGGTGCDAEDNATEGTADEVMFTSAAHVVGMYCHVSSSGSNGVSLNLRDDTANLTPNVTITIPTGVTSSSTGTKTVTRIAASSAVALRVVNTEDLSAQDAFCVARFQLLP